MYSIDQKMFLSLLKTKQIHLIDIRDSYLYEQGTIKGAINIPYRFLRFDPRRYLLKEEVYYIFCSNGTLSERLTNLLNSLGYQIINVEGGYDAFLYK